MRIIDVAGLKKSGKTTVVENLVAELTKQGFKVGTVKKIHIPDFSIDQEGKDTYRHKQAGAEFVISLAPKEIALIKSTHSNRSLDQILDLLPDNTDFLICEELNEIHNEILYIIALRAIGELEETLRVRAIGDTVLAISGVVANSNENHDKYPIINSTTEPGRKQLVDMILNYF